MGEAAQKQEQTRVEPQEFLTVEEAAELLRVNHKTLREVIANDAPPWAKNIGKQHRISRTALLKWFETEIVAPKKVRR